MQSGTHGASIEAVPCRAQGVYMLRDANTRPSFRLWPGVTAEDHMLSTCRCLRYPVYHLSTVPSSETPAADKEGPCAMPENVQFLLPDGAAAN